VWDFAELEQRIELLCDQAASRRYTPGLAAEIEWVLAEGYLRALQGDFRRRALAEPEQSLAGEATRRLRYRLAVMREHWVALEGGRA
jgi:hypothetical protein